MSSDDRYFKYLENNKKLHSKGEFEVYKFGTKFHCQFWVINRYGDILHNVCNTSLPLILRVLTEENKCKVCGQKILSQVKDLLETTRETDELIREIDGNS